MFVVLVFFKGRGHWFVNGASAIHDQSKDVSGVFKLPKESQLEMKYSNKTKVKQLLYCNEHEDCATYKGFSEKDTLYFSPMAFDDDGEPISIEVTFTQKDIIDEESKRIDASLTGVVEEKYLKIIHALTLALAKKTPNLNSKNKINASAVEKVIEEHCQTVSESRKIIAKAIKIPFNNPKV